MRCCMVKRERREAQRTRDTVSSLSNTPATTARWKIMARTLQLLMLVFVSVDTAHDSIRSITHSMCRSNEYYDTDRDACFDMCGESKCQTHQKCSTKFPAYTGTHRCVDLCFKTCASPLYCNIKTAYCDPCVDICSDHNEETLRQCRIFCLDVYREIVESRTSTAVPLVSTSPELPRTSCESISSDQIPVSEPTQLSPGLVAASVVVPVVICGVLLSVIVLCIRWRRLLQMTGGSLNIEEDIPLMSSTDLDQYMTILKGSYGQQIKERNEMEKKQYGNVIPLDQHQPVIINHGLKEPDRQKRLTYDEFVIETSDREQLTLENFLRDKGRGRPRSVLMLGGPGMGKTSICYTILDRFVKGQWMDHQYIFYISLKGLVSMASIVSLADILFDFSTVQYNHETKETLIKQVKERQNKTLMVLDGYDECDEFMTDNLNVPDPTTKAKPEAILKNLVSGNMLPDAQVLLTSRPFKSTNDNLGVKRVVQLAGLTAKSVRTLLEKNVTSNMDAQTLGDDIVSLLSIPVNLQKFLSYLTWIASKFSSANWDFPRTKTSLYSVQMISVLRQTIRFIDFNPITELEMWSHPLVLNFLSNLAKLASTASDKLGHKQIMFQYHELQQCGLDENSVKHGGLMTSFTKPTRERDGTRQVVYFYFIHLTNLEWVCALHIVNTNLDYIRSLIRRNQGQLDIVLCFAVGLLGDKEGQVILERVHGMSSKLCQDKADQILRDIIQSDRCTRQPGGHQYALEVYHEGQFTRPQLLLPLLAPDGPGLVMTDIANYNRHAVHYFLLQLIASQDGRIERAETATDISNIESMMLHFFPGADSTKQDSFIREIGKLKKLKYLSIQADGGFRAAVEQPLELLTVHGGIDGHDTVHIIENSSASILCLFSTWVCNMPLYSSVSLQPVVKELHLGYTLSSSYALTIESIHPLRAATGLWYDHQNARTTLRLLEKSSELLAVGLSVDTEDETDCTELTRVLASSHKILSIAIYFGDNIESLWVMILAMLSKMTSLREIWLTHMGTMPDHNKLATLGETVCAHIALNSVALLSGLGDINITAFLKVLSDNNRCLSTVYTDQRSQLDSDLVKRATRQLVNVNVGWESKYYTPLVYSPYLLTSVPAHIKEAIRKRYVSLHN